jgi:uncharacterized protein YqeY
MSLQQQVADDMKAAMKARDTQRRDVLRSVMAAMKNQAVELGRGPQGELSDEEVESLLTRERKKREEAAAGFADGGREESAAGERAEAAIIAEYLPEQLSDDELDEIVGEVIDRVGADAGMGPIMGQAMGRVGNRADGKRVNAAVRRHLG